MRPDVRIHVVNVYVLKTREIKISVHGGNFIHYYKGTFRRIMKT